MDSSQRGRLGSKNPLSRRKALEELVGNPDGQTHEILLMYLSDTASVVRAYAAVQLVTLYEGQYVQKLIPLLADEALVRQPLVKALKTIPQDISLEILKYAKSSEALVRAGCASILGVYPSEEAVTVLIGLLEDADIHVRLNAAKSLGDIGDARAIEPLLRAVDDRSDLVGRAAIMALGDIQDPSVLDILVNRLSVEQNRLIKQAILYALGELRNPQAAPALLNLFLQPQESEKMRDSAALALTFLGDQGKQALQTALDEGDEFAKRFAKTYLRL